MKKNEKEIKVRHILASGKEVKSIKGRVVPETNRVYKVLRDLQVGSQK